MADASSGASVQRRKYPAFDLEQAIKRVTRLYEQEKRNPVPVAVAVKHLGYSSPTSGPATSGLSAVKQFGLIDDSGSGPSRKIRLSQLAYTILQAPAHLRAESIKQAALNPTVHRAVWDTFRAETGSDDSFRWHLINEMGFSERGADEFMKEYRSTIEFAGLSTDAPSSFELDREERDQTPGSVDGADAPTGTPADTVDSDERRSSSTSPRPQTKHIIPLVGGQVISLEGAFPLTPRQWDGFIAILEAFRPGLVDEASEDQ